MTAHVIVLASINAESPQSAADYARGVQPLLLAAGVTPVFRASIAETLVGEITPATAMVLEFPDTDEARAFFAQEAYQKLLPMRRKGFSHMEIHITNGPSA